MGELKGCLQAILQERAVAADADEHGVVTLSESRGRGRSPMRVQVSGVPSTATVVSLQRASQHPILQDARGRSWNKICDYMLVDEGAADCAITMVELKTTLQNRSEGLEQLRRSLPMANTC